MKSLPSLFISHGAPTYALQPGIAGRQLAALGRLLPRPEAVLVVSPHWMTADVAACSATRPTTIHDFAGFGDELLTLRYPAPGHPLLAQRTLARLRDRGWRTEPATQRGLDHGAWVPLRHLYPAADVPVFQVSMPFDLTAITAVELGLALAPLADEGVLIVGSGSLTHNLHEFRMDRQDSPRYVCEFASWVRNQVLAGGSAALTNALDIAPHASRAHPSAEHFFPLLIALGAAKNRLPVTVLDGGVTHGALAMESYVFGASLPDLKEIGASLESRPD